MSLLERASQDGGEWIEPTLLNSWVDYDAGFRPAGYKLNGKTVTLRGLIKDGTTTSGTSVMTLLTGHRPGVQEVFVCETSTGQIRVDVAANGAVVFTGTAGSWLSLSGISFDID